MEDFRSEAMTDRDFSVEVLILNKAKTLSGLTKQSDWNEFVESLAPIDKETGKISYSHTIKCHKKKSVMIFSICKLKDGQNAVEFENFFYSFDEKSLDVALPFLDEETDR